MSDGLQFCLAAVLVQHYEAVFEAFPACRLITKMQQHTSHETLMRWSKSIQQWFQMRNSNVDCLSFDDHAKEVLRQQTELIIRLEDDTNRLRADVRQLEVDVRQLRSDVQKDFGELKSILQDGFAAMIRQSGRQPEAVSVSAETSLGKRKRSMQGVMDGYVSMTAGTSTLKDGSSLGDTLQLLFCEWFVSSSFTNRTDLLKRARVIFCLKLFLPAGTTLRKPSPHENMDTWRANFRRCSLLAEAGLLSFMRSNRPSVRMQGNKWRNCHDQLKTMNRTMLDPQTVTHVIDEITPRQLQFLDADIADASFFPTK